MPAEVGILVLGHARPHLLRLVLESLQRQNALATTHVWIDGTSDLREVRARPQECVEVARQFPVAEIRAHRGHLGNNKIILDAVGEMNRRYERFVVLEDDCFPTRNAIRVFAEHLEAADRDDSVFSVYGHPFLVPAEGVTITRFQGWGWATTRRKVTPILRRATELYLLPEKEFLAYTRESQTPEIVARLAVTPGRNVCHVLDSFYSWDACLSLLSAQAGLVHQRTAERVIFNCGLGGDTGHFHEGDHLRQPPFNMINPEEVWAHF